MMFIDEVEHEKAEKKLLIKIQEAEEAIRGDKGWLTLDELIVLLEDEIR